MGFSATMVKNAKPGRYVDGDGLFLEVSSTGRKAWFFRYQMGGRRRDMALGAYPAVSLAVARTARDEARDLIEEGKDPIDERRAKKEEEAKAAAVKCVSFDLI